MLFFHAQGGSRSSGHHKTQKYKQRREADRRSEEIKRGVDGAMERKVAGEVTVSQAAIKASGVKGVL